MSQHVITAPSSPLWRRRSFVVVALIALLAAGIGAAIGALVSDDSSVTYRSAAPAEHVANPVGSAATCTSPGTADGDVLLAVIVSVPDGARMVASLSPQTQELVDEAAAAVGFLSWGPPTVPDAPALAATLSRLPTADRGVVANTLAPDLQAAVGASLTGSASPRSC